MENISQSQDNDVLYMIDELEKKGLRMEHFSNLDSKDRKEVYELNSIIMSLRNRLVRNPKPTTNLLANQINQALKDNPYGGGVVVRVFRDINSKIEKCSIIDIYLNNQSKETTNPKRQ